MNAFTLFKKRNMEVLLKKLEDLKKFQDGFLDNKEEAYRIYGSYNDSDRDLLMRQKSFREGYHAGWIDCEGFKKKLKD